MQTEPVFEITAYQPYWLCWLGRSTGRYWATPNWQGAPDLTIEAGGIAELDERMTEVEEAYPQQ